jgi:hypothetical protein
MTIIHLSGDCDAGPAASLGNRLAAPLLSTRCFAFFMDMKL